MNREPVKILLFEDDESQALLTREALEQEGFQIDVAANAKTGLQLAVTESFEVFLIDIKLPDASGVEVLKRLHALRPGALAIVVTGHGDEKAAVEAMKAGAYDYVVKSPSLGHLAALPVIIAEGLKHRQLRDERESLRSEVWEFSRLLAERNAEVRRLNRELKRYDSLRADLVAMLTHDLRNPLATIKEFSSILSDGLAGKVNETQRGYLQIIVKNVNRLAEMIRQLLMLTRIEGGYMPLRRDFIAPENLVKPLTEAMRPVAESKHLSLIEKLPVQAAELFIDGHQFRDVLSNLLDNAIKYSDGPGRITIEVKEEERSFLFSVEDTGRGMTAAEIEKVFHPQGKAVSEEKASSLSISLAMSQRIVELHGGRIWAESEVGKGSRFFVVLPKFSHEEVFYENVRSCLEQAKVSGTVCSLVAFSIANAATYIDNDRQHELEKILVALQGRLSAANRQRGRDTVLYWREGSLVLILAPENREGAARIAERLAGVLHAEPLSVDGRTVDSGYVTATATYPDEAHTAERLLAMLMRKLGRPWDRRQRRVLVIGETTGLADQLRPLLDAHRASVHHTFRVSESMDQFETEIIDCVILDATLSPELRSHIAEIFAAHRTTQDIPVLNQSGDLQDVGKLLGALRKHLD